MPDLLKISPQGGLQKSGRRPVRRGGLAVGSYWLVLQRTRRGEGSRYDASTGQQLCVMYPSTAGTENENKIGIEGQPRLVTRSERKPINEVYQVAFIFPSSQFLYFLPLSFPLLAFLFN